MEHYSKTHITIDEFDVNMFRELPFLIEALNAYGNKIIRILGPIHTEIEQICEKSVRSKNNWFVKRNRRLVPYPFIDTQTESISKNNSLSPHFGVISFLQLANIVNEKWKNYFIVEFGYWVDTEDESGSAKSIFYFGLSKGDDMEKYGGSMHPLKYYEDLSKEIGSSYEIELYHPELEGKEEYFSVGVTQYDVQKIFDAKEIFISRLLEPTIKDLMK